MNVATLASLLTFAAVFFSGVGALLVARSQKRKTIVDTFSIEVRTGMDALTVALQAVTAQRDFYRTQLDDCRSRRDKL